MRRSVSGRSQSAAAGIDLLMFVELGLILSQGKPGVKKDMSVVPVNGGIFFSRVRVPQRHEAARWYRTAIAQGASGVGLSWVYKVGRALRLADVSDHAVSLGQVYGWRAGGVSVRVARRQQLYYTWLSTATCASMEHNILFMSQRYNLAKL